MNISPDKKRIRLIISGLGLAVLTVAFTIWAFGCGKRPIYLLMGLGSTALFAALCLRYVPCWVDFWWGNSSEERTAPGYVEMNKAGAASEADSRRSCALIFAGALVFCFFVLLLAWLIRLRTGWQGSFKDSLQLWLNLDSRHYLDIARDWYLSQGHTDRLVQLVFFPGYPLLIRLFNLVVGDWLYSAFIASALCFAVACVLLYKLLLLDMEEAKALSAVGFLCLVPGAFFFAAPMSESLFLALSLGCIYLLRKDRWFFACVLGALAGFTRSLGIVLIVPAIFELFHRRTDAKAFLKRAACILVIPLGLAAYCMINYTVSGDPFKFKEYLSGHWGQNIGWFFNTAAYQLEAAVSYFKSGNVKVAFGLWGANLFCSFMSLILLLPVIKRLRPSYGAYFLCYYIAAIGATWLLSAPRYLTVQFVLPAALALLGEREPGGTLLRLVCAALSALYLCAFVLGCQVW